MSGRFWNNLGMPAGLPIRLRFMRLCGVLPRTMDSRDWMDWEVINTQLTKNYDPVMFDTKYVGRLGNPFA